MWQVTCNERELPTTIQSALYLSLSLERGFGFGSKDFEMIHCHNIANKCHSMMIVGVDFEVEMKMHGVDR